MRKNVTKTGQRVKSVYFPEDRAGKGIVALAFNANDPDQLALFAQIENLGSTEIRAVLGLATWADLVKAAGKAMHTRALSSFLRERLAARLRRKAPDRKRAMPRSGKVLRSAPAGTEDSPARAEQYMDLVEAYRRERKSRGTVRLIDPFAGTGNYPVAAGARGWASWYCENDVLARRHLELKVAILSRSREVRGRLARQLADLSREFDSLLDEVSRFDGGSCLAPIETARAPLGRKLMTRAIAARRVADALLAENALSGGCFEVAVTWAAASCARARGRKIKEDDFDRYVAIALSDFTTLCESDRTITAMPSFLCGDARDLGQFAELRLNAVVTTLPPFEAVDQSPPPRRVQAWMLRQPDPASGGLNVETLLREWLAEVDVRQKPAGNEAAENRGASSGLTPKEIAEFLFARKVPRGSFVFSRMKDALGSDFRKMAKRIERAEGDGERSAPTLRRAGLAAVRYVAMFAQVLEGLLAVRDTGGEGGLAVIEVASTRVLDMHVDTPGLVAKVLESLGAIKRDRWALERRRSKGGGETVRDVLVYAFPEDVG